MLTPYLWAIKLGAAGLLIASVLGGVLYFGHRRYVAGYSAGSAAVLAADAKTTALAKAAYAAQEAAWAAQLKEATDAYQREIDGLRPIGVGPVRLCHYTALNPGDVPGTPAAAGGPGGIPASAGGVQPVPSGNPALRPDGGPDIGPMLAALGRRADKLSAQTRALIEASK